MPVKLDRKESAVCGLFENWPQRNVLPKAARKKNLVESPKRTSSHSETRPETIETGRRNETRKAADNRRRNERAALFEAHRGEYLHNRGWPNPENRGLHHEEWAQEEMAAFHRFEENLPILSLCHLQRSMAAVCFPTADIFLLQMQARQKAVSIIFC